MSQLQSGVEPRLAQAAVNLCERFRVSPRGAHGLAVLTALWDAYKLGALMHDVDGGEMQASTNPIPATPESSASREEREAVRSEGEPQVVAERKASAPDTEWCSRCAGTGLITGHEECPRCKGTGNPPKAERFTGAEAEPSGAAPTKHWAEAEQEPVKPVTLLWKAQCYIRELVAAHRSAGALHPQVERLVQEATAWVDAVPPAEAQLAQVRAEALREAAAAIEVEGIKSRDGCHLYESDVVKWLRARVSTPEPQEEGQ